MPDDSVIGGIMAVVVIIVVLAVSIAWIVLPFRLIGRLDKVIALLGESNRMVDNIQYNRYQMLPTKQAQLAQPAAPAGQYVQADDTMRQYVENLPPEHS